MRKPLIAALVAGCMSMPLLAAAQENVNPYAEINMQYMKSVMHMMDTNHDGKVTKDEFMKFMKHDAEMRWKMLGGEDAGFLSTDQLLRQDAYYVITHP